MKQKAYIDFSGGYSSDLPDDKMPDNMLRTAENVFWRNGLRKREGVSDYGESGLTGCEVIQGFCRAYMNSAWTTVVAVDNGTNVQFYQDNATAKTFVVIDSPAEFTVTTDNKVKFAKMKVDGEDVVCGVNGVDKPFIIYYDSGFQVETIEAYDERTRTTDDWYAGTYDDGAAHPYIDDTADAQSTTADDFALASATNNDGFYIAGVLTYNKIVITSASQFDGSPVASYQYYKGDNTWGALSMVSTPTWTAAAGDRTIEFDYPTDWATWDGDEAVDGDENEVSGTLAGRWVIRVRFTTAPTSAQTADYLTLYHTQYLTQIMDGDIPHEIVTHKSRLFLAAGPNVNYSPYGQVTGWEAYSTETFIHGGPNIMKMVTLQDTLQIFKDSAIYALAGSSAENWAVYELTNRVGTINGDTLAVINQIAYFLGNDRLIYGWNGQIARRISKHIQSDLEDFTLTNVNAIAYNGDYWISFPSDSTILRFDPDAIIQDEYGEGLVPFFKYTGIQADEMVFFGANDDTRELIASQNVSTPAGSFVQLENGNYYDASDTDIAIDVKTKDLNLGLYQTKKRYTRIKPDVEKAGEWIITLYSNHEADNVEAIIESGVGPGQYSTDIGIPYEIDGKDMTMRFQNTGAVNAVIYGFALEYAGRVF